MRRVLLAALALLAVAPACAPKQAPLSGAASAGEAAAQAGFAMRRIGDARVTTLLDGHGQFPAAGLFVGVAPEEAARLLQAGGELAGTAEAPAWRATVQGFVVDAGGQRVLIDTGTGGGMIPDSGRLSTNLAAAGIAPESIRHVVVSHFHGDHLGGLIDGEGRARYPRATLHVQADEAAFWRAQQTNNGALVRRALAAYEGRVRTFRSGPIVPGLTAEPAPGHTPGHTLYRLASRGRQVLFVGDLIHAVSIQAPRPDVVLQFDTDQAAARAARLAVLNQVAGTEVLVAGPHFPFPGVGRFTRAGEAYRFTPAR